MIWLDLLLHRIPRTGDPIRVNGDMSTVRRAGGQAVIADGFFINAYSVSWDPEKNCWYHDTTGGA